MTHTREPVSDSGALLDDLLEHPRPSVTGDVVVTLHVAFPVPALMQRRAIIRSPA